MIYSKIIICLSVFQEQIFYYKLGNQMTAFLHEHESITFMSKEAFHKQIFHHKLSNSMSKNFVSKKDVHQQLINTKHSGAQKCTLTLKSALI
jgi:hypothetical protein